MARQDYGWVKDDPASAPTLWNLYNVKNGKNSSAIDGDTFRLTFATGDADAPDLGYVPADKTDLANKNAWERAAAQYHVETDSITGSILGLNETVPRDFVISRDLKNGTIVCYVFERTSGMKPQPDDGSWTGHR
jgi:hypothetical protein